MDSPSPGAITIETKVTGTGESKYFEENRDALGVVNWRRQAEINGVMLSSEFTHDWAGRVLTAAVPHAAGDTSQGKFTYTYDAAGQATSVTMPDQRVTTIDYVSSAIATGSASALFTDPNDGAIRATISVNPNGLTSVAAVNQRGSPVRVVEVQGPLTSVVSNSSTNTAANLYSYGSFGSLLSVTDPDGEVTTLTYDNIVRRKAASNGTTGQQTFNYDALDQVTSITDGNGNTYCYGYDSLGRKVLQTKGNSDGTCPPLGELIASWQYDGLGDNELGRMTSSYRESGPNVGTTTHYFYEKMPSSGPNTGRLSTIEQDMPGTGTNTPVLTESLEYSGPWLSVVHYPNLAGSDFAIKYDHDPYTGAMTAVSPNSSGTPNTPYWHLTAVDQANRMKQETFGNGVTTDYDYYAPGTGSATCNFPNSASCMPGKLHSMTTTLPGDAVGSATRALGYTYDTVGNLAQFNGQVRNAGNLQAFTDTYTYDDFYRLETQTKATAADGVLSTTRWNYSLGGDITNVGTYNQSNQQIEARVYTYNPTRHHLLDSFSDTVNSGTSTQSFQYDGNGNTLQRGGPGIPNASQGLDYNDFNMPYAIRGGIGGDTTLEYDGSHQRVAKRGPQKTTLYMGDLYECEGNSSSDGSINCDEQRFNIYARGKLVTVVTRDSFNNDKAKYIHADHLGSTTLITDAEGAVAEYREFEPFGTTSTDLTTSSIHSGYTGQEHDAELGLINMKGRLYDPVVKRFLTPDPYVSQPFDTQGLNRYSYVINNPTNYTDPSGFECVDSYSGCGPGAWYYAAQAEAQAEAQAQSQAQAEAQAQAQAEAQAQAQAQAQSRAQFEAQAQAQADAAASQAQYYAQSQAAQSQIQAQDQTQASQVAQQKAYEAQLQGQSQAQADAQRYQNLFNQPSIPQPQNRPPTPPNQTADPSQRVPAMSPNYLPTFGLPFAYGMPGGPGTYSAPARLPDYVGVQGGLAKYMGGELAFTVDRNGHTYVSPGIGNGLGGWVNMSFGWLGGWGTPNHQAQVRSKAFFLRIHTMYQWPPSSVRPEQRRAAGRRLRQVLDSSLVVPDFSRTEFPQGVSG